MAIKLTAISIANLKPKAARYEVGDSDSSLRVVVMPSGAKSYAVRYRVDGRTGKLTIGPTTDMSLSDAREAARDAMKLARAGIDPAAKKQADKAQRIAAREAAELADDSLIEHAVEDFIRRHVSHMKSAHEVQRLLRKEVIPVWKGRRIEAITKRDVLKLIDDISERGAPTTAKRTFANVRKFFNWALGRDYPGLDRSPCERMGMPSPEVKRDRVLTDRELRLVLAGANRLETPWREFVRLLAYTGTRRNEVAGAPWREFTGLGTGAEVVWELPPARTKNGLPHMLPLPAAVAHMLEQMPVIGDSGLAFTVTGSTPLVAFSAAKEKIDGHITDIIREEAEAAGRSPEAVTLEPWRWHDIRRTVATGMAAMKIGPHVVEAVLNHASGVLSGVAGVYNRYSYLDEKRAALAAWADHIAKIEGRAPIASNVVQLRA